MQTKQEEPTNRGMKAADVLDKFLSWQFESEYFGAFASSVTSHLLSIQSVAPSATVWCNLKGEFKIPNLGS